MTRKTVIIILLLTMGCSMLSNAATRETVPQAPATEKSSAAAADKADGAGTGSVEQEGSVFEGDKPRRGSPLVIAAMVVLVVAAVYFLVIKKSSTTAENTRIEVNSVPDAANIIMDGQDTGKLTNNTFSHVTPGHHSVKLSKTGYEDYVTAVWVTSGQTVVINAALIKN